MYSVTWLTSLLVCRSPKDKPSKTRTPKKGKSPKAETPKGKTPKAETLKGKTPKAETPKGKSPKATPLRKKAAAKSPKKTKTEESREMDDSGVSDVEVGVYCCMVFLKGRIILHLNSDQSASSIQGL